MKKEPVCDYCGEEMAEYKRVKSKDFICESCMQEELEQVSDEYYGKTFEGIE